jgi:hypothetical protein
VVANTADDVVVDDAAAAIDNGVEKPQTIFRDVFGQLLNTWRFSD